MEEYRDLALVIAWPDQTARGDEQWMAILKRVGIVKNLNFRVGHAAIVLVNQRTGLLAYYDFGRYVTPRGYGRARSAASDPRLVLATRAKVDNKGHIDNLHAILTELHQKESATHGGGRLFFSIADGLSFGKATRFAQGLVDQGPIPYGAVARGNNSCSRFVAQVLLAGWETESPIKRRVKFPESLKPSPMSNVVNASPDSIVHCYHEGILESEQMTRWHSLRFQVDLLLHNLSTSKAKNLPCDNEPGNMAEPKRPASVPVHAHWLGGIGEGAWYALEPGTETGTLLVVKYGVDGQADYQVSCQTDGGIDPSLPYQFTYDCHYQRHVITQCEQQFLLETCERSESYIRTA
ncbi:DUF6695 family protein [Parapedobacter pyrenivorans]|uniref:DUF6695 family protein n=1 Tax=Parapedobacter pyrenivorans TaxID=1305674 RepID=UPI00333EFEA6